MLGPQVEILLEVLAVLVAVEGVVQEALPEVLVILQQHLHHKEITAEAEPLQVTEQVVEVVHPLLVKMVAEHLVEMVEMGQHLLYLEVLCITLEEEAEPQVEILFLQMLALGD